MYGSTSLLDRKKIGYLASSTIASLSVQPTLDWATEVSKYDNIAIVSGFHSKMEHEVLDYLLRGKCGIVCVLAQSIYKKIPDKQHSYKHEVGHAHRQGDVYAKVETSSPLYGLFEGETRLYKHCISFTYESLERLAQPTHN